MAGLGVFLRAWRMLGAREDLMDGHDAAAEVRRYSEWLDVGAFHARYGRVADLIRVFVGSEIPTYCARRKIRVLLRDRFRCVYCGCDFAANLDSLLTATLDHVVPRAAGGCNQTSNLVAACTVCNQLKRNTPADNVDHARRIIAQRRNVRTASFTQWAEQMGSGLIFGSGSV